MDLYFYNEYMFQNGSYIVNNGDGTLFFFDHVNRDTFYLLKNHNLFSYYNTHGVYELEETLSDIAETLFFKDSGYPELIFSTSTVDAFWGYDEGNLTFYCDTPSLTDTTNNITVNGLKIIDNSGLPIFNQINNAVDYIFFNGENPNTVLFETNGTLFDFQITTKTVTYALSITTIILCAVGVAVFIKGIFNLIRGR